MRTDSSRALVAKLAAVSSGGLLSLDAAVDTLGAERNAMSRRLSALVRHGWLMRVRRGLYAIRPLEFAPHTPIAVEDPWAVAMRTFEPCYIGGWSAAGHWHLTEQLFRSTLVVTGRVLRARDQVVGGSSFHCVRDRALVGGGVTSVWRHGARIEVSTVERTLLDACAHPDWVGGGSQLIAIMRTAIEERLVTPATLLREARHAASGAALGRLGLLLERLWSDATIVLEFARAQRGTGYVLFDPAVRRKCRLATRWGVWMNVPIAPDAA